MNSSVRNSRRSEGYPSDRLVVIVIAEVKQTTALRARLRRLGH
jgi:hypothetical protein